MQWTSNGSIWIKDRAVQVTTANMKLLVIKITKITAKLRMSLLTQHCEPRTKLTLPTQSARPPLIVIPQTLRLWSIRTPLTALVSTRNPTNIKSQRQRAHRRRRRVDDPWNHQDSIGKPLTRKKKASIAVGDLIVMKNGVRPMNYGIRHIIGVLDSLSKPNDYRTTRKGVAVHTSIEE
jgi:hypothetical protein